MSQIKQGIERSSASVDLGKRRIMKGALCVCSMYVDSLSLGHHIKPHVRQRMVGFNRGSDVGCRHRGRAVLDR